MNQRTYTEPVDNKSRILGISLLITEIGCMVGYGLAGNFRNDPSGLATLRGEVVSLILMFIFVVVGFGMLNNIYRFGNWLGSATAIIVIGLSIQLSPLLQKFWFSIFITGFGSVNNSVPVTSSVNNFWNVYTENNIEIGANLMRTTLLSCISIMTVMCAVVGRINVAQLLKLVSFYQIFWNLNYFLLIYFLVIRNDFNSSSEFNPYFFDMFGTTYVYLFAAFFGLPFTCLIRKQALPEIHPRNEFNRLSLLLSQIGTGFIIALFVFTSSGVVQYTFYTDVRAEQIARFAILFGIIGSIAGTYIGSAIVGRGRVGFKEALTGTVSGAVVMGSSAPVIENIGIIIMIGSVTGLFSGIYMRTIHVRVNRNNVKDVVGLFGPFLIAAFLGSIVVVPAAIATYHNRGIGFPFDPSISVPANLAGYQLIYAGLSAAIGLGGGLFASLFSICDKDYFALASNSRIFENEFGLYDLGEAAKSRQMLPLSTGAIPYTPEPYQGDNEYNNGYTNNGYNNNGNNIESQQGLNRSSNLL